MHTGKVVASFPKGADIPTTTYAPAPPADESVHVLIQVTKAATTLVLEVPRDCKIEMLKSTIAQEAAGAFSTQGAMRLVWAGDVVDDSQTLLSCGIGHESTLFLV